MQQLLPQNYNVLIPDSYDPKRAIEYINSHINKFDCCTLNVDISFMNVIDACYVSTMCSANHYVKYPEGEMNWLVSSNLTEILAADLGLGNSKFIVNS